MSYRIVETTDRKNIGQVLPDSVALHANLVLRSGADFSVDQMIVVGDTVTLSNANYIIIAVKE
jgi:hypothetical protein